MIQSVVTTFGLEFPYFEPAREKRRFVSHLIRPGIGFDEFLGAVAARWGAGVRRLGSKEDDFAVTLFARPVHAKFVCYRESGLGQTRPFSFQVNAFYDAEDAAEVSEFLEAFSRDADAQST